MQMIGVSQQKSSAKRKQMFKTIQSEAGVSNLKQLLIDMKVQWSSTYFMLHRAESNKKVCKCIQCMLHS
jgi:hypothetical protein